MSDPIPAPARKPGLLIVDDDPLICDTLNFVLSRDFNVCVADSREQARSVLRQLDQPPPLALVDLGLPPSPHRPDEGFRLIAELVAYAPEMKIVVLSGQSDDANARHARTLGAIDFVAKPADPSTLKHLLLQALQVGKAEKSAAAGLSLLGKSMPVEKLRRQIVQFAASPFPVLVQGESGSGKELIARAGRTLYALNCAAISPTLVEPTLFGYAKGAFTGATASRAGYFEDARDSTLFLDEIGELPLELQAKLLRVLENGEFQRVDALQLRAELDTESLESPIRGASGIGAPCDASALKEAAKRQLQTERGFHLDDTLARWEHGYVEAALEMTQGNLTRAAKMLGLNRTTLYSRMQQYATHRDGHDGDGAQDTR